MIFQLPGRAGAARSLRAPARWPVCNDLNKLRRRPMVTISRLQVWPPPPPPPQSGSEFGRSHRCASRVCWLTRRPLDRRCSVLAGEVAFLPARLDGPTSSLGPSDCCEWRRINPLACRPTRPTRKRPSSSGSSSHAHSADLSPVKVSRGRHLSRRLQLPPRCANTLR